jgi:hypothetical protein
MPKKRKVDLIDVENRGQKLLKNCSKMMLKIGAIKWSKSDIIN